MNPLCAGKAAPFARSGFGSGEPGFPVRSPLPVGAIATGAGAPGLAPPPGAVRGAQASARTRRPSIQHRSAERRFYVASNRCPFGPPRSGSSALLVSAKGQGATGGLRARRCAAFENYANCAARGAAQRISLIDRTRTFSIIPLRELLSTVLAYTQRSALYSHRSGQMPSKIAPTTKIASEYPILLILDTVVVSKQLWPASPPASRCQ